MTDRIQSSFELWAQKQGFTDLTQSIGRYNRAVVRWMWLAWQEQSERVADMAAALERSYKRSTDLLKQCRDHDTRRAAAVAQCAAMAEENERQRFDILAMNQSLDLLREENERLKELMAKRTREHQQEMTSFRLRVRSQDDATFAVLREENERLANENAALRGGTK